MLKKLVSVVLFGISNLYATDTPKTGLIKKIKHSSTTAKIVVGIMPCIATIISMEIIGRAYKNRPDKNNIVIVAHYIKCIALGVAIVFYDWIIKFHIKKRLSDIKKKNKKKKETEVIPSDLVPITT